MLCAAPVTSRAVQCTGDLQASRAPPTSRNTAILRTRDVPNGRLRGGCSPCSGTQQSSSRSRIPRHYQGSSWSYFLLRSSPPPPPVRHFVCSLTCGVQESQQLESSRAFYSHCPRSCSIFLSVARFSSQRFLVCITSAGLRLAPPTGGLRKGRETTAVNTDGAARPRRSVAEGYGGHHTSSTNCELGSPVACLALFQTVAHLSDKMCRNVVVPNTRMLTSFTWSSTLTCCR